MKSLVYVLGYFFYLLPCMLLAQSKEAMSQQALFEELNAYHQKNLLPVYQQQRQKFNEYLEQSEIAQLYTLAIDYQNFSNEKKQLFDTPVGDATQFMKTWERLQQEEVRILVGTEWLTEKYFFVLQNLLKDELQTQIKQWRSDLNLIIAKYNLHLSYPYERLFAKYGFGRWSDPAYFILWQAQKPINKESAAEMEKN